MDTTAPGRRQIVLWAVLFEGGLALLAWGAAWLLDLSGWPPLWWDTSDAALGLAACLPMLALFWLCLYGQLAALQRIRDLSREFIRPLFAPCSVAELALIALVAGFGEELLFRGVLQPALADRLGLWPGMVLAGVVFGLVHSITPTYALLASLMGIYLGAVWAADGNLLVVILAHALYDFIALVYLVRGPWDI